MVILRRCIIAALIILPCSFGLYAEEPPLLPDPNEIIEEEAPAELINLNLGDSSVSLRIAGRWKGTLELGYGFALTPLGTRAMRGENPFFTQEGDITLSLWIRDRWFVEASFMEDSALNTYRAGYQGKEGEAVRYVGVGNTGLDFPVFPYLDLGGDSPSSFGAYGYFAIGNFSLHSLIRYDAAAREERVFVGNRERNFGFVELSRPQRGVSFVLPDENLSAVPVVYFQDKNGPLMDSDGNRWRIAEPSEYGASARYGLVQLTLGSYTGGVSEPPGMVAVYYPGGYGSMGRYYGSLSSGSFLGMVQEYFDDTASPATSAAAAVRLWDFPQPGQRGAHLGDPVNNVPGTVTINGFNALVIYESGTFSPFEKLNRYLAPANTSSQASLVKLSTGETITDYVVIPLESFSAEDIQNSGQYNTSRMVYELLHEGTRDRRSPSDSWPLAENYPDFYLPGQGVFTEDLGIRFTNYSSAGEYNIGTDVVPGSVQVYRNGILDPNFTYSPSSGVVSLMNVAGFSEVIRISYLKQSSERRLGSLAAGIGTIWDPDGPFSLKLGIGLRWNVSQEAFSEDEASSPGTVGLGLETRWDFERLKTGVTLGLGFEQPDTTGLYRVTGMEGNELVLPLPAPASFISEAPNSLFLRNRADLVYRDFSETSFLGSTSINDIYSSAPIISGESGPYPAIDKTFSSQSQVLVAEFEFSADRYWTGFQTPLGVNGEFLELAGKIEVPYRFMNFSETPSAGEISVILQIGSLGDMGENSYENQNLLVEKKLFPPELIENSNKNIFNEDGRIATINLTDEDRIKLKSAKYIRLLIIRSGGTNDLNGRVVLSPPIVRGAFWRPVVVKNGEISGSPLNFGFPSVSAYEQLETGSDRLENKYPDIISRLHSGGGRQRVLEVSWEEINPGNYGPGADARIPEPPLGSYRSLSFFVRRPLADKNTGKKDTHADQLKMDSGSLHFILAQGPLSLKKQDEISLDVEIPLSDFKTVLPGQWTKVEIQFRGDSPRILVDGKSSTGPPPKYRSNLESGYAIFYIIPGPAGLPKGNFAVDEIILDDPVPSYRLNNGVSAEWILPGTILNIKGMAFFSDLSLLAAVETGAYGNPFDEEKDGSFGMNGRSRLGFSVLDLKITGSYSYSVFTSYGSNTNYSWSGGHSFSRAFGPFSFLDAFDVAPDDITMSHRLTFNLDTKVRGYLSLNALQEDERISRQWLAGTGSDPFEKVPLYFSLDTSMGINEKNPVDHELANYAIDYGQSFVYLIPDSGEDAYDRDLGGNVRFGLSPIPLGSELFFQGNTNFSLQRNTSGSGSLLRLDFPLVFQKSELQMLFRYERDYRREIFGFSRNFGEDLNIWAESFGDARYLMFSVPFYSLFAPKMQDRMNDFSGELSDGSGNYPDFSQFSDRFDFSLQKAMNYGLSSLIVPNRFGFRLGRVLEQKLEVPLDTLNIGTLLGFSSINLFGAMGAYPLFNFYMGDEFSHSIETLVSIPKNENVSWTIRAEESLSFFGFKGAELMLNNNLTINSANRIGESNYLSDAFAVLWSIPSEKTLLGSLYGAFTRMAERQSSWLTLVNLAQTEYELLRRESLEFIYEKIPDSYSGDYVRFSILLGHESVVRIFGKLNLSVFTKLRIEDDTNTRVISFLGVVGTTLNLTF